MQKYVHIDEDAIKPLCNAIMAQAIKDYTVDPESRDGREAKQFMQSEWFEMVSYGMDGNAIIAKLDKKMKAYQELCGEHVPKIWKDTEEAIKCIFRCPFCGNKVNIQWNGDHCNYNGNKVGTRRTYTHQCEGCGIRQTYEFKGFVPDVIPKNKICRNCRYLKTVTGRSSLCLLHKSTTTRKSTCKEWTEKAKKE